MTGITRVWRRQWWIATTGGQGFAPHSAGPTWVELHTCMDQWCEGMPRNKFVKKLKNIWHFRHFIDTCHLMCRIAGPQGQISEVLKVSWNNLMALDSSPIVVEIVSWLKCWMMNLGPMNALATGHSDLFDPIWTNFKRCCFGCTCKPSLSFQDALKIRKISYESMNRISDCYVTVQ